MDSFFSSNKRQSANVQACAVQVTIPLALCAMLTQSKKDSGMALLKCKSVLFAVIAVESKCSLFFSLCVAIPTNPQNAHTHWHNVNASANRRMMHSLLYVHTTHAYNGVTRMMRCILVNRRRENAKCCTYYISAAMCVLANANRPSFSLNTFAVTVCFCLISMCAPVEDAAVIVWYPPRPTKYVCCVSYQSLCGFFLKKIRDSPAFLWESFDFVINTILKFNDPFECVPKYASNCAEKNKEKSQIEFKWKIILNTCIDCKLKLCAVHYSKWLLAFQWISTVAQLSFFIPLRNYGFRDLEIVKTVSMTEIPQKKWNDYGAVPRQWTEYNFS